MDRQYQYVFVGDSDYHGLLSYHTGECIDPVVKKGMTKQHSACGERRILSRTLSCNGNNGIVEW